MPTCQMLLRLKRDAKFDSQNVDSLILQTTSQSPRCDVVLKGLIRMFTISGSWAGLAAEMLFKRAPTRSNLHTPQVASQTR